MQRLICLAALMAAFAARAQEVFEPPGWAYPLMDEGRGRGPDDGTLLSVPGSDLQLTQTRIDDPFNPPNWYPDDLPPMPQVVSHGRPPNVRACGQCHMLHGMGHRRLQRRDRLLPLAALRSHAGDPEGRTRRLVAGESTENAEFCMLAERVGLIIMRSAGLENFRTAEPARWYIRQ